METLLDMPNVGPVLSANLNKIGVETPEALRAIGAEEAWVRIRANVDSGACLHQLQALEGAVQGVKKSTLSPERKRALNEFYKRMG